MTHKEARISKGFARQQCEAFADEFGMSIQSGVQDVQISDGTTDVIVDFCCLNVSENKFEIFVD